MTSRTSGGRLTIAIAAVAVLTPSVAVAQALDFETYKTRVEPVFLRKRPGHARCIVCHESGKSAFHLQPLSPGSTNWTEAQSRMNFENVSHLVKPGDPMASKLLVHPLSPDDGGDEFHSGGWQFVSRRDDDWMAIADWVMQAK